MDIDDCFNILKNRVVCEGHSCVQALCQNEFITPGISKSNLVSNALVPHDLIGQFLRLQEERVQVYKVYNSTLQELLDTNEIHQYNFLCAEVTARMKAINAIIIDIKIILETKNESKLSNSIKSIQEFEGQKLVLVAAMHLDAIQTKYPNLKPHISGEETSTDSSYNRTKVSQLEERICELLEEIIAERNDNPEN